MRITDSERSLARLANKVRIRAGIVPGSVRLRKREKLHDVLQAVVTARL